MRPRARAAVHIGRELRLSKVFVCVFALWAIILSTAACSPSEPAVAPAEPTLSPAEADLTARQTAVQRRRESEELPVGVDEHVLVEAGDQVEVDETGRALLRFQDNLLVELFRDTEVRIADARLEPGGFIFVRLKQAFGHTRTKVESLAEARVALETDYATIRALDTDTEFLVCHGEALTCMVTVEGEAEVEAQGQTVVVGAGEATYVLPNEPPQPVLCADLGAVNEWLDQKRGSDEVEPLGALVAGWPPEACPGLAGVSADTPSPPAATPESEASGIQGIVEPIVDTVQEQPLLAVVVGAGVLLLIILIIALIVVLLRGRKPAEEKYVRADFGDTYAPAPDWTPEPVGPPRPAMGMPAEDRTEVAPGGWPDSAPAAPSPRPPAVGPGVAEPAIPEAGGTRIIERAPKHLAMLVDKSRPDRKFDLKGTVNIGRAADNQMVIDHPTVSRHHAWIKAEGEDFVVFDIGSGNGTFVNDERVEAPRHLENGDIIRFGKATFIFTKVF